MNASEDNTKELENYGVWVKNTSRENSNPSEKNKSDDSSDLNDFGDDLDDLKNNADNSDSVNFDSADFSDMFKDDVQFSTNETKQEDFALDDLVFGADESSNDADFENAPEEIYVESSIEKENKEFPVEIEKENADNLQEDFSDIPTLDSDSIEIPDFEQSFAEETTGDAEAENSSDEINLDGEDISLDDFMDGGFSDESVAAGNNGYEPGKENPSEQNQSRNSSETEELSLGDFFDGDFETSAPESQSQKEDDIAEEPPLEMDISFDNSAENVETEENISIETYDDFDEDSDAVEAEEVSLDDFSEVFNNPIRDTEENAAQAEPAFNASASENRAEINIENSEEIDLSDFGIDKNAEETPINQNVEESKKKDAVVDYDLFVDEENASGAPVVNEIKSAEKSEIAEVSAQKTEREEQKNALSADASILQQIMAELKNLKNDINALKSNIEEIKTDKENSKTDVKKNAFDFKDEQKVEPADFSDAADNNETAILEENDETRVPAVENPANIEKKFADEEIIPPEEDVLADRTAVAEESPIAEEISVEEEIALPEEDILSDDEILTEDNAIFEEPILAENEDSAQNPDDMDLNFDFGGDEVLKEPTEEDISEISIDESFEDALPEEISIPKDDIFVESNSQDFMNPATSYEANEIETPLEKDVLSDENFETENREDDVPTVEKLLETTPLSENDFESTEQEEISVADVQAENERQNDDIAENEADFIDLANDELLDEEPIIEETAVDFEKEVLEQKETDDFELSEEKSEEFSSDFAAPESENENLPNQEVLENQPSFESEETVFDTFENPAADENKNEAASEEIFFEETPAIPESVDNSKTEEQKENVAAQKTLNSDLMRDVKSLLVYMDQLLEDLPEEKIEEFANSDKFVLFKNVFEKLGLN